MQPHTSRSIRSCTAPASREKEMSLPRTAKDCQGCAGRKHLILPAHMRWPNAWTKCRSKCVTKWPATYRPNPKPLFSQWNTRNAMQTIMQTHLVTHLVRHLVQAFGQNYANDYANAFCKRCKRLCKHLCTQLCKRIMQTHLSTDAHDLVDASGPT